MFGSSRKWRGGELKQRRETVGLFLSFLSSFSASLGEILMRSWKEEEEFAVGAVKNMTVNHIHAKFAGNGFSRTKIKNSRQSSEQKLFLDKIIVCVLANSAFRKCFVRRGISSLFSFLSLARPIFTTERFYFFSQFCGKTKGALLLLLAATQI